MRKHYFCIKYAASQQNKRRTKEGSHPLAPMLYAFKTIINKPIKNTIMAIIGKNTKIKSPSSCEPDSHSELERPSESNEPRKSTNPTQSFKIRVKEFHGNNGQLESAINKWFEENEDKYDFVDYKMATCQYRESQTKTTVLIFYKPAVSHQ